MVGYERSHINDNLVMNMRVDPRYKSITPYGHEIISTIMVCHRGGIFLGDSGSDPSHCHNIRMCCNPCARCV